MSETNLEKLQRLLREMFQFESAELDFGIYRIMYYKRDVIEKFISKDLPKAISVELEKGALSDQAQASKELKEVAEQIHKNFGRATTKKTMSRTLTKKLLIFLGDIGRHIHLVFRFF